MPFLSIPTPMYIFEDNVLQVKSSEDKSPIAIVDMWDYDHGDINHKIRSTWNGHKKCPIKGRMYCQIK